MSTSLFSRLARVVLALLLLIVLPAMAEDVAVDGTFIRMEPPSGYENGTTFTGFQDKDGLWWISVTEAPISVEELLPRMSDAAMKEKGMEVQSRKIVERPDGAVNLIIATQSLEGAVYEKLVLIIGNDERSAAITAGYLASLSDAYRDTITSSLLTAQLSSAAAAINLDGLPYTFQDSSDLKAARRVLHIIVFVPTDFGETEASKGVFFSLSPLVVPAEMNEPESIVMSELGTVYSDIKVSKSESISLDGLQALEFQGSGTEKETGSPIDVYYLLLQDPETKTFLSAFGETPSGQMEAWLPSFQAVGRSMRLKSTAESGR